MKIKDRKKVEKGELDIMFERMKRKQEFKKENKGLETVKSGENDKEKRSTNKKESIKEKKDNIMKQSSLSTWLDRKKETENKEIVKKIEVAKESMVKNIKTLEVKENKCQSIKSGQKIKENEEKEKENTPRTRFRLIRKKFEEGQNLEQNSPVSLKATNRSLIFKEKVSGKLTLTPSSVNSEKQPENKSSKKQLFDSYELGNMSRIEGTKVNSNGKRKYYKIINKR